MNRREVFKNIGLSSIALSVSDNTYDVVNKTKNPIVISTWDFGLEANKIAWKVLSNNGYALDAIEKGINMVELDPNERSVGYGGRPDREGKVTLDACIMDEQANIGAVLCIENIATPISVARKVMEITPHVMLSGKGAHDFAISHGFKSENLMVEASQKEYLEWLKTSNYKPQVNIENHDTIGMVAMDDQGRLCGGCSTSGMAYKMHGRIGDSPIIGAGLYVDNEVGAVTATGHGEEVVRVVGSFLVVELMRNGLSPSAACREAVVRIKKKFDLRKKGIQDTQIGFIALNKYGFHGAFSLRSGFTYAVTSSKENKIIKVKSLL
jgi:N4-(beta-N-acetylglucosaminyl)-L-asparaginase